MNELNNCIIVNIFTARLYDDTDEDTNARIWSISDKIYFTVKARDILINDYNRWFNTNYEASSCGAIVYMGLDINNMQISFQFYLGETPDTHTIVLKDIK